jgi:hypothetical protein
MTDDREYLELAAKAAGIEAYWPDNLEDWQKDLTAPYVNKKKWNPLTDDGDALRLAVKLKLETEFGSNFVNVGSSHHDSEWHMARESDVDLYAATRRAIVRAAAEIGKGMK